MVKNIRNIFYSILLVFSVISCSDNYINHIEEQIGEDDELVSLPIGVNIDSSQISTKGLLGPTIEIVDSNPEGPVALEIKVTYEDQLKAFYIDEYNSYGNMITPLWDTEDIDNIKTNFSFVLRCPKRWDPSKIRVIMIGKGKYFDKNSLMYNKVGKDDSRINLDLYKYWGYGENTNRIYFLDDSLSDTNDWKSVKSNFTLKNLTSKIIILSDEYKDLENILRIKRRDNYNWDISTLSLLESKPERNILDSHYTFTYNNTWSMWKPNGYTNLYYNYKEGYVNYSCNIHDSSISNENKFTAGGFGHIPADTIMTSHNSHKYNFNYKGRKVSLYGILTVTLGHDQSLPKIVDSGQLWDSDDAGKDIEYLRILGNAGRMRGIPEAVEDTILFVDGVVPLPNSMKPNHIYIISNKPNTRFLNYSIITGDDRKHLKPLVNATGITRGDDNYIVEEYDMDDL